MTNAATIRDVARAAGVSVATVSRALNGSESVLPETRARVEGAARSLRFTPSMAARSLITRRTDTIGALLPDLHGEYFSEFIRGVDQAARARGLHLLVSSSHGDAAEAAAALRALHGRVDGLLVMTPHADAHFLEHNLPVGLPAVLVNSRQAAGLPRLSIDNAGGARAMTRHLVASGRRRIAFIRGHEANEDADERLRGFRAALGTRALRDAALELEGDFSEAAGAAAARRLLRLRPRPDAVFAANDMMAVGCLAAFAAAGVRVPEEIAVVGFDDIPIARYVQPALTTVRVPIASLGASALETLVRAIAARPQRPASTDAAPAAPPAPGSTVLPVELAVRRSCGGAAERAPSRDAPAAGKARTPGAPSTASPTAGAARRRRPPSF